MSAEGGNNERQVQVNGDADADSGKESEEEDEEGILPALCQNAVVFAHLRSYLPKDPKSVREQRQICRTWYTNTLRQWRARNTVNVSHVPDLVEMAMAPRMELVSTKCLTIQQFLDHYQRPGDMYDFHSAPILHMNCLCIGVSLRDPYNLRFWEWSAPALKSLTLHRSSIANMEPVHTLLLQMTPNLQELTFSKCMFSEPVPPEEEVSPQWMEYNQPELPNNNMKSITVQRNIMSDYDGDFPIPLNWLRLLSFYPNLKKIRMEDVLDKCDVKRVFNAIDIIKKARGSEVLNITELAFRFVECVRPAKKPICSQTTLYKIKEFQFPLTHVELSCSGISPKTVVKFLKPYRSTLKTLVLTREKSLEHYDSLPHHMLPRHVTKLGLVGRMFVHWDFLRYLKQLECLEIDMMDAALLSRTFERNMVYVMEVHRRKIKKLVFRTLLSLNVETCRLMVSMMPGVKDLSVGVEMNGFTVLCHGYRGLTRLEVQKPMMAENHFVNNLILLQNLTELVISYSEGCTYPKFGDRAIMQGIIPLPKLKKLEATFAQVSPAAKAALRNKISDMKNVIFL